MSPLGLRRFRAERLLREEYERLRASVLSSVAARLRADGAALDRGDLEDCYAQAWQGLYSQLLDGREVRNPPGWLVVVTYRRAIEELRARRRAHGRGDGVGEREQALPARAGVVERDLAAELDDRARLRALMEGMRCRLDAREREAAALCYLQGLSRRQAAARMGLSEARMRKLMDGRERGRPGVAAKVGALVEGISEGRWCAEQGSLMRALAFGLLDPDGERYRIAALHRRECPACRAYVASLRGAAAVLPPALAPLRLAGSSLAGAGAAHGAAHLAAPGAHGARATAAGLGASPAPSPTAAALGGGAGASAGAGVGAGGVAGGGWLLAGPVGAKLALGCLLALGVGAGCVELRGTIGGSSHATVRARASRAHAPAPALAGAAPAATPAVALVPARRGGAVASPARSVAPPPQPEPAGAAREFGPEQRGVREAAARAVAASTAGAPASASVAGGGAEAAAESPGGPTEGGATAAEREFSP
jgi:RNA polymerase sigma factor (sigma-70 family)